MTTITRIREMRSIWIENVAHALARGEGVRENFIEQLHRFYDLMQHAVEAGDAAWLDPLIDDWVRAQTQTEVDRDGPGITPVLSQILLLTVETCRSIEDPEERERVLESLLPVLTHAYERATHLELQHHTAQIENELREAQHALELLDRSKSNFIAVAAHELKTPLTLIEGYASMLRELFPLEDHGSQPVLLLKGIDNGTERLQEIVDDMIDVSLIDNDMLSLTYQPIWMSQLLQILEQEFREAVAERDQTLTIQRFPGCNQMTYGDPERLYQAFRNLVSNAIKFTPNGGKITIDGRKLPGFIEVVVSDTGIGIHPQDHNRIFEKFGQLGNVQFHSSGKTKFKGGGPGLGLPITRGIIEAHGGTIWVESEQSDEVEYPGSTFHVLLPIHEQPPDDKSEKLYGALSTDLSELETDTLQ